MKTKTQTSPLLVISCVTALIAAIGWLLSGYPYVGFLWLLLWSWVQFRIWQDRRTLDRLTKELESQSRAMMANVTDDNTFVRDLAGNFIPISHEKPKGRSDCQNCKYFYGKHNVVCSVHPSGYEGESCGDRLVG